MPVGAVSVLSFGIKKTEDTFNDVLEEYGSFLRNSIAAVCPRDLGIQIDDIEQEARIRLWKALQKQTEIEDYASYIYRIAFTTTIDAVRRVKARKEEQFAEELEADENGDVTTGQIYAVKVDAAQLDQLQKKEIVHAVENALTQLSDERKEAVKLHLQGFSSNEIAVILGWTEPKARNLLYRGLKDLRDRLQSSGIEYTV